MKRLFAFVVLLWATSASAQTPVMQQRCQAQACAYSSWNPNRAGDTLVVVIRTEQIGHLPCESTSIGCGDGLYLVSDLTGNQWQRAYSNWTSEVWYALNAKPGLNIVGVMASHGYGGAGEDSTGGDFTFDVVILEFSPAIGLDSSVRNQNFSDNNNNTPHTGQVTATSSDTLLIAWTNNLAVNNGLGPLTMTPDSSEFAVLTDDGFLAVADCVVKTPGTYSFSATYSGNALWTAGLVAFKMGTPETQNVQAPASIAAPHEEQNEHRLEKHVPNENEPAASSQATNSIIEERPTDPRRP